MRPGVPACALVLLAPFATAGARAQCTAVSVRVDADIAGSGYSEERPENWESHNVGACNVNYRYLSRYVGDGSRRGRAIFTPSIAQPGWYDVTTGWRASANRTNDADYLLYDNAGAVTRRSINQRGDGCSTALLGTVYCAPGGACRVVLDGDDGQSDAADITTFTRVSCDGPGGTSSSSSSSGGGACAGLAAQPGVEVCAETATTCAGVFTQGQGCTAYCAAAGMRCVARFGGEPGCSKEPNNPLACGANNGHLSDWCECAAPPAGASSAGAVAPPSSSTAVSSPGIAPASSSSARATSSPAGTVTTPGPLRREGRELRWCGQPIQLVGYGDYGMIAESAFGVDALLDLLRANRVNLVRAWGLYHFAHDLVPFAGTWRAWDLQTLSDTYFQRMLDVVRKARARGIIVQLTLFDSVMLEGSEATGNRWRNSPYRDGNNAQPYLVDATDFNAVPSDAWTQVNRPYIQRVVDTLCREPNVIYEVMNEPDGSGAEAGLGSPAFVDAVIGELHALLARPQCTGSRVLSTNDHTLRTLGDPRVDLVSLHTTPENALDHGGHAKPVMVSNDGDDSQVTTANGFGTLDAAARLARIRAYAASVLPAGTPVGTMHLEILDKDLNGSTWLSDNYDPRATNASMDVVVALGAVATGPNLPCDQWGASGSGSSPGGSGASGGGGQATSTAGVGAASSPGGGSGGEEPAECTCDGTPSRHDAPWSPVAVLVAGLLLRSRRRRPPRPKAPRAQ